MVQSDALPARGPISLLAPVLTARLAGSRGAGGGRGKRLRPPDPPAPRFPSLGTELKELEHGDILGCSCGFCLMLWHWMRYSTGTPHSCPENLSQVPWGLLYLESLHLWGQKGQEILLLPYSWAGTDKQWCWRDPLWGFREREGTQEGHAPPPHGSRGLPCIEHPAGARKGSSRPSPASKRPGPPDYPSPLWEVPSSLRPAGGELKLVTSAALALWLQPPPTHPRVFLQEPSDPGGTACHALSE